MVAHQVIPASKEPLHQLTRVLPSLDLNSSRTQTQHIPQGCQGNQQILPPREDPDFPTSIACELACGSPEISAREQGSKVCPPTLRGTTTELLYFSLDPPGLLCAGPGPGEILVILDCSACLSKGPCLQRPCPFLFCACPLRMCDKPEPGSLPPTGL